MQACFDLPGLSTRLCWDTARLHQACRLLFLCHFAYSIAEEQCAILQGFSFPEHKGFGLAYP